MGTTPLLLPPSRLSIAGQLRLLVAALLVLMSGLWLLLRGMAQLAPSADLVVAWDLSGPLAVWFSAIAICAGIILMAASAALAAERSGGWLAAVLFSNFAIVAYALLWVIGTAPDWQGMTITVLTLFALVLPSLRRDLLG